MGQKTNPKGFRLVTTQKHLSNWYSKKQAYSLLIKEDYLIRTKIEEVFKKLIVISKIEINRVTNNNEHVNITIHALFPRAKEIHKKISSFFEKEIDAQKSQTTLLSSKENLREFTDLLLEQKVRALIREFQKKTSKNYHIGFNFIKNPFEDAALIAKYIGEQLEKRVPFRRVIKQTIKKVQYTSIKGLKIQVSGRLNGIDIARSEWKREGKIPLHTLKAKIDYTHQCADTVYGIIGIKVWLFIA